MKLEPIVSSETSAIKSQTPGNYPKGINYKFYILFTQRICMFCVEFRTNSDYFPIEYYLTYIYIYVEDAAERTPQFWRIVASGGERVQWWGATIEQRCTCRFHC